MQRRPYAGPADLGLLQEFNAAAIAQTDHCGYLHPGDIPHHLYNGNRRYDPAEVMSIWEDERGVAAWLLVGPRHKSFDAQIRPDLRGSAVERDMLAYAGERTAELMRKHGIEGDSMFADAFQGDSTRHELLVALGWEPESGLPYVLNRMVIPPNLTPALPDGYTIETAEVADDPAALAEVHNGAFGAGWTPESYRQVMESPGYDPARELVIRGPGGDLVAFTIIWFDSHNRMGLFEPVGTHKDHQRRGFGRAIMLAGLRRMAAAGMVAASVAHFGDNDAARGLYQSLGFRPWHLQDGYVKSI